MAKARPKTKIKPKAKAIAIEIAKPAMAKAKRKPNAAFMKAMNLSSDLQAVIGAGPYPRTEVVKRVWAYIKKNNLQDAKERRNINGDDKLRKVLGGKKTVSMFEMTKLISNNLSQDSPLHGKLKPPQNKHGR